jgi:hypothetical protein
MKSRILDNRRNPRIASWILLRMSARASGRDNTDRSLARSASDSVPAMSKRQRVEVARKNRPVGYGMIKASTNRCAHLHESGRTLRDTSAGLVAIERFSQQAPAS